MIYVHLFRTYIKDFQNVHKNKILTEIAFLSKQIFDDIRKNHINFVLNLISIFLHM